MSRPTDSHVDDQRPTCSGKVGDGLHLPIKAVDEHPAWPVLTGEADGVFDRIVELRVEVELLSTPTTQPRAVFLFDDAKKVRAHATNVVLHPSHDQI
jgi:hypothetical protein